MYLSDFRVAGHPVDIQSVLVDLGYSGAVVNKSIAQAYTAASVAGPLKAAYEAELAGLKGTKVVKKAAVIEAK